MRREAKRHAALAFRGAVGGAAKAPSPLRSDGALHKGLATDGTEGQPSPTGRYTFSSWRLWKKDDPLVESGLPGPVTLQSAMEIVRKP